MGCSDSSDSVKAAAFSPADSALQKQLKARIARMPPHVDRSKDPAVVQAWQSLSEHVKRAEAQSAGVGIAKKEYQSIQSQTQKLELRFFGRKFDLQVSERILLEVNAARTNPGSFLPDIEKQCALFEHDGRIMRINEKRIMTSEGKPAWLQAIEYLKRVQQGPKLGSLKLSESLSRCAFQHLIDIKGKRFGHQSSDGTKPFERLKKYVKYAGLAGQNLNEGESDPRKIVVQMLVDDGLNSRKDRLTIFEPQFQVAGMYEIDGFCCMCFVTSIIE